MARITQVAGMGECQELHDDPKSLREFREDKDRYGHCEWVMTRDLPLDDETFALARQIHRGGELFDWQHYEGLRSASKA